MAQKFKTSISIQELATAASQALGIKLYGENFNRLQVDAGGKITWGAGASAGDVNLYRSDAETLTTDDIFHAVAGVITLTTSGAPTTAMADGALAIDTDNDAFYFRSNSTWQQVTGGGGSASVTVSDDPPVDPEAGNLWYESDTGSMYIYYNDGDTQQWVEVGGSAVVAMTTSDTAPASANNGDLWFETDTGKTYVRYDDGTSAQWVEIGAASALSAQGPDGSIQFANTGSLDSSPDLYWDDANSRLGVGTNTPSTALEVDGTVTATEFSGPLSGNATTASALETGRSIELTGDVTGITVFDGSSNVTISASLTAETSSLGNLSDVTVTDAQNGELLIYDGTEWVNDSLPTSEPMGHEDRTASTISFDAGTRVFSIAPVGASHTVWCAGVRFVKTTTETVTLPSTPALYYIYYDTSGVLQYQTSYFTWHEDTPTAYLYWNGTDYLLFDERHGITLDWATHEYLHRTRGAVIADGLGASNYVTDGDGSADIHMQIDIADGTFFDEDLEINITHSVSPTANSFEQVLQGAAEIPMIYLSGTTWTFDSATTFPLKLGSALPTYNLNTSGTWSTPDLGNGTFGVTWIVATNILGSPIIGIMGQEEYNNIGQAEAAEWSAQYLDNFPVVEMRPLFKVAYEVKTSYTNTNSAAIRGVYDLRRYGSGSSDIPAFPVSDHGSLTGLSDDDHLQYLTDARHDAHDHSVAMGSVVLYDISNVSASAPSAGEYLKWDGTGWTSDVINLGSDTSGDYVESLVAGTGITLSNNTGEGSTPTIEIGQDVSTTANVTFNTVNADLTGNVTGNADTATTLQTSRTISLGGDLSGSASFDGSSDITISATIGADSVALGTDTTGDYIESLTAGTGVTVYNGTGEGASAGIAIGQDVGTTSSVTFASVTANLTGNVTGDVTGDLTGNADTATTLQTARTIELSGDVAGSVSFDGSGDVVISTTVQADSVALGTDTTGDFIESLSAGTGVTVYNGTGEGASAGIAIGQDVATSANVTFNDLILTGNLTVQGTTTTLETDTLQVEDNIIVLNYGQATPSLDAGIEIERGSGTNVRLQWDEANDIWEFTNDGTTYYPLVTTLGDISNIDFTTPPSTNDFLKFDGTNWIAASIPEINSLSDIGNVTITSIASGEYLKWNGTAWVNDEINLGTDTAGDYVESLTAGTGVTIYGGTGEGASATIEIGQDVSTSASASFDLVTGTSGVITTTTTGEPTAALPDGALAIDTTNDRFYFRSNSTWNLVSGGAGITVSDTAPSSPTAGQLWYESDTGIMLIYYDDGDTQQWVEVGGISGISASLTDAAPSNPYVGDIWFDTTSGRTYLYYDDGSSGQWVEIGATGDDLATVASGAPASPSIGQMWYDTLNEQLLVYDGTSWLASAGATATVSPTEPAGPDEGDLWYDTANGEMFIYSGTEWLSAGGGASVTVQDTAPADPEVGDMWFESDTGRLLVYYDSTWVEVGGAGGGGGTSTYSLTSSSSDAALFIMEIGP